MRVKDPERIIEVPGCVGLDRVGHGRSVRVQTPGPVTLTSPACMPDIAVQEHGGEIVWERHCPHILGHCRPLLMIWTPLPELRMVVSLERCVGIKRSLLAQILKSC